MVEPQLSDPFDAQVRDPVTNSARTGRVPCPSGMRVSLQSGPLTYLDQEERMSGSAQGRMREWTLSATHRVTWLSPHRAPPSDILAVQPTHHSPRRAPTTPLFSASLLGVTVTSTPPSSHRTTRKPSISINTMSLLRPRARSFHLHADALLPPHRTAGAGTSTTSSSGAALDTHPNSSASGGLGRGLGLGFGLGLGLGAEVSLLALARHAAARLSRAATTTASSPVLAATPPPPSRRPAAPLDDPFAETTPAPATPRAQFVPAHPLRLHYPSLLLRADQQQSPTPQPRPGRLPLRQQTVFFKQPRVSTMPSPPPKYWAPHPAGARSCAIAIKAPLGASRAVAGDKENYAMV
ncbi:hypothetical protein B0H11DRAFT_1176317 [Mycena galericulata]|nr:hypothetical protein B0H11DRAFT_1176317 [Mycena galericulata]